MLAIISSSRADTEISSGVGAVVMSSVSFAGSAAGLR